MTTTNDHQSDTMPSLDNLDERILTVDFWRDQLNQSVSHFKNMTELADQLAAKDQSYAGAQGYLRLQNAKKGRASLLVTYRLYKLINQIIKPE